MSDSIERMTGKRSPKSLIFTFLFLVLLVAAGIADRLELQVSYAIGVARPLSLMVETFGTGRVSDQRIIELVNENFDLRPAAIIRDLNLRRLIFQATAAYGHFGRDDIDAPWEYTDKSETLRHQAGLD